MVRGRAYPAYIRYDSRHLFRGSAKAEALKTAQFSNLPEGIRYITFIIEKNFYFSMPFQPGNGIYCDFSSHFYFSLLLCFSDAEGKLKR
jgi:hypothetical protein